MRLRRFSALPVCAITQKMKASFLLPTILLLSIVVCLLFPGAIFSGKTLAPVDLLYFYAPWHGEFDIGTQTPSNWILFDEMLEFHPWRQHLRTSLFSGNVPLWDSTAFCGYPFCGLFQTAFLYPPDRMMDPLPESVFPLIRALFHIFIAGLGTALYLKRLSCPGKIAALGAVAYGCSGFMLVWLGHPHIKVAAWLPWLYLAVETALKNRKKGLLYLSVVAALILSAGHIETAMHLATSAGIYFLLRLFGTRRERRANILAFTAFPATALALLFSAAMTIPFAEYLVRSVAFTTREHGVVVQAYLDRILAFTHIMPKLFGSSADHNYWYHGFNSAELGGAFIGVVPLIFGLAGFAHLKKKPILRIHAVIIVFCAAVVYKIPPIYQLAELLPGYKMSYNFRLLLPLSFSLVVSAALQLESFVNREKSAVRTTVISSIFIALLVLTPPFWIHSIPGSTAAEPLKPMLTAFFPLTAFWIAAALWNRRKIRAKLLIIFILVVTAAELTHFGAGFNPEMPVRLLHLKPQSVPKLTPKPNAQPFRVLPLGFTYPPHTCLSYGFQDIRGNDALTPQKIEDIAVIGDPSIRRRNKLPALRMMWINTPVHRIWNLLNVRYVVSPTPIHGSSSHLEYLSRSGGVYLYFNRSAFPRVFLTSSWKSVRDTSDTLRLLADTDFQLKTTAIIAPAAESTGIPAHFNPPYDTTGSSVSIDRYSNEHITVSAHTPAKMLMVLSDTYFPGWLAQVDGKPQPILRVDHALRGVFLPPGDHCVTFSYHPVSYLLGMFLTLLSLFAFSLLFVFLNAAPQKPDTRKTNF